jgi:hypothetical protein
MFPAKNYTIGRGRLYFDRFAAGTTNGTGQRYIGNTPELNMTSESESLDHFDSDNGVRQKDASVLISLTRSGSFITDHVSPENLALFFLGTESVLTTVSALAVVYNIADVKLDHRYQIGASASVPAGVRGITNVIVKVGVATKVLNTDYTLDEDTGGVIPLSTGSIVEGDDLEVTYDQSVTSYNRILSGSASTIEGSLLYISTNPEGEKFDYFFPKVAIKPDGDYALKGEEFQQIGFTFEALKKDDNTEVLYVNGRPGSGI